MLRCGRSKSFIETHCSSLLWALFIPKKTTKFEMFGFIKFSKSIKPFSRSCLNGLFVCGSNPTEYTVLRQQARSNRRVQEVVRVKQKKNWNSIVLQRFEPPGFILRRSDGFWVFCGVALRASMFHSLTSDRCLGARVSDPPLSPMIFFRSLAPRGCFLHWNGRGVFFPVVVCVNNKKSPRTGRFFSPVRLMRA